MKPAYPWKEQINAAHLDGGQANWARSSSEQTCETDKWTQGLVYQCLHLLEIGGIFSVLYTKTWRLEASSLLIFRGCLCTMANLFTNFYDDHNIQVRHPNTARTQRTASHDKETSAPNQAIMRTTDSSLSFVLISLDSHGVLHNSRPSWRDFA